MPAGHSDLLTKAEAARKLRVSPSTVDRLRAQGEIAWILVGRQVRFRPEAIDDYIEPVERRAPRRRGAPIRTAGPPAAGPAAAARPAPPGP
jgi:excisionase family DNA binding protein